MLVDFWARLSRAGNAVLMVQEGLICSLVRFTKCHPVASQLGVVAAV